MPVVEYKTVPLEELVGWYYLTRRDAVPNVRYELTYRPHWWHRFWVRVFFGWTWEDAPTPAERAKPRGLRYA